MRKGDVFSAVAVVEEGVEWLTLDGLKVVLRSARVPDVDAAAAHLWDAMGGAGPHDRVGRRSFEATMSQVRVGDVLPRRNTSSPPARIPQSLSTSPQGTDQVTPPPSPPKTRQENHTASPNFSRRQNPAQPSQLRRVRESSTASDEPSGVQPGNGTAPVHVGAERESLKAIEEHLQAKEVQLLQREREVLRREGEVRARTPTPSPRRSVQRSYLEGVVPVQPYVGGVQGVHYGQPRSPTPSPRRVPPPSQAQQEQHLKALEVRLQEEGARLLQREAAVLVREDSVAAAVRKPAAPPPPALPVMDIVALPTYLRRRETNVGLKERRLQDMEDLLKERCAAHQQEHRMKDAALARREAECAAGELRAQERGGEGALLAAERAQMEGEERALTAQRSALQQREASLLLREQRLQDAENAAEDTSSQQSALHSREARLLAEEEQLSARQRLCSEEAAGWGTVVKGALQTAARVGRMEQSYAQAVDVLAEDRAKVNTARREAQVFKEELLRSEAESASRAQRRHEDAARISAEVQHSLHTLQRRETELRNAALLLCPNAAADAPLAVLVQNAVQCLKGAKTASLLEDMEEELSRRLAELDKRERWMDENEATHHTAARGSAARLGAVAQREEAVRRAEAEAVDTQRRSEESLRAAQLELRTLTAQIENSKAELRRAAVLNPRREEVPPQDTEPAAAMHSEDDEDGGEGEDDVGEESVEGGVPRLHSVA